VTAIKIKWPNDIYFGDRKLGGMLFENILQGGQIKNAIVGIGLNINQENFAEMPLSATSIKKILQRDYELKNILAEICNHIEAITCTLKPEGWSVVRNIT
jgi:BirA family biotin operon repressor/biotin-[acetyl-CoA-carboxylase] ligase